MSSFKIDGLQPAWFKGIQKDVVDGLSTRGYTPNDIVQQGPFSEAGFPRFVTAGEEKPADAVLSESGFAYLTFEPWKDPADWEWLQTVAATVLVEIPE